MHTDNPLSLMTKEQVQPVWINLRYTCMLKFTRCADGGHHQLKSPAWMISNKIRSYCILDLVSSSQKCSWWRRQRLLARGKITYRKEQIYSRKFMMHLSLFLARLSFWTWKCALRSRGAVCGILAVNLTVSHVLRNWLKWTDRGLRLCHSLQDLHSQKQ